MPIPVTCPSCAGKFNAPDSAAGRKLTCPACKGTIEVSRPSSSLTPFEKIQPITIIPSEAGGEMTPVSRVPKDTIACSFCSEPVLATARKCKHCGETLDVAIRAAEEASRAATRSRRDDDDYDRGGRGDVNVNTSVVVNAPDSPDSFPHAVHIILTVLTCGAWLPIYILHAILASRGGGSLLAFLIGGPLCVVMLFCAGCATFTFVGALVTPQRKAAANQGKQPMANQAFDQAIVAPAQPAVQPKQELDAADELFKSGKLAEAVTKYKANFTSAPNRPEVLRKIVEFEAGAGNGDIAGKWIDYGLNEGITVAYETAPAKAALARVQQDRQVRAAQAKEQALEEKKRKVDEQALAEKRRVAAQFQDSLRDLTAPMPEVRLAAVLALGQDQASARRVIPQLATATMDTDANVRQAAAEALVRLGVDAKPAVAMLVESLGAKSDAEQIRAARALGLLGPLAGDSGVVLVPLLGEQKTRAEAAKALGRIGRPTVPLLIKALDSKNALMRLGAAEALEQVGADAADAIPALSARVRTDSSASVREAAERTLKKIKR